MATTDTLLTIDEYAKLPDGGRPTELVQGRIVEMNLPTPLHGKVCANVTRIVGDFVERNDLGHVLSNDAGIVTSRNPDSLRGADVSFYSYKRLPKGPMPAGYLDVVPNAAFEVRSESDRWADLLQKIGEYLSCGVEVVVVLDPASKTVQVHRADGPQGPLSEDDSLELPGVLPGFREPVSRFFG